MNGAVRKTNHNRLHIDTHDRGASVLAITESAALLVGEKNCHVKKTRSSLKKKRVAKFEKKRVAEKNPKVSKKCQKKMARRIASTKTEEWKRLMKGWNESIAKKEMVQARQILEAYASRKKSNKNRVNLLEMSRLCHVHQSILKSTTPKNEYGFSIDDVIQHVTNDTREWTTTGVLGKHKINFERKPNNESVIMDCRGQIDSLEKKLDATNTEVQRTCCICWDATPTMISIPCSHFQYCDACADDMKERARTQNKLLTCAVCRMPGIRFTRVY